MTKSDVLDRVAADLTQGRTDPAIRRLSSLVAAHPTDLDLRHRLAAVHRLVGNAVEAGRWSYLSADADASEAAAFERAYPSPSQRLHRLCWPERQGHQATEFARTRLAHLTAAAGAPARPAAPAGASWAVIAVLIGLAVVALAVLGAVTVVQWIIG
jgi:hypothetical protein